jgi:predicted MPP superfamily phosphohydrolase
LWICLITRSNPQLLHHVCLSVIASTTKTEPAVFASTFFQIKSLSSTHGLQKIRIAFLKDLDAAAAAVSET